MALGELQFGEGRNYDNFITINVGYGIGAGIILGKRLFYGTDGMAGEFGHLPVWGDKLALEIFKESIEYLGSSIAGMINIFNPQAIFVGGGVSLNGPVFWDNLIRVINENILDKRSSKYKIQPVTFPGKSAIYGVIGLVLREVLSFNM